MEVKRQSLVKPRLDTPFHIDFDWWQQHDRDWRVFLRSFLCPEHQETFMDMDIGEKVDWIDPETAEVQQMLLISQQSLSIVLEEKGLDFQQLPLILISQ